MTAKDKTAIENLIIVARYIEQEGIMTATDEILLAKSISLCEKLIDKEVCVQSPIVLCESGDMEVDDFITALKRRKNLD